MLIPSPGGGGILAWGPAANGSPAIPAAYLYGDLQGWIAQRDPFQAGHHGKP
jgi:hypothetical protein